MRELMTDELDTVTGGAICEPSNVPTEVMIPRQHERESDLPY
jgi:hypothetical protein